MEEQVIQETPVAAPDQSVAGTVDINVPAVDNSAAIRAEYEAQISALKKQAAEADERFQGIKVKLDEVYKSQNEKRLKTLEDQGQYKPALGGGQQNRSRASATDWRLGATAAGAESFQLDGCHENVSLGRHQPSWCD